MLFTSPAEAQQPILDRLQAASHVLVLTHVNPDGDAIGSMLGVAHQLRALGKHVTPLAMPPTPVYADWLPGMETVQRYQPDIVLPDADLVVVVDTASMERLGTVYPENRAYFDQRPMIVIDHHVTNDGRGDLNLIQPEAASTCELLYQLFVAMNQPISAQAATCLLLGLTTDTQSFQTSSTSPASLRAAADLISLGADHERVIHEVYYALPAASAALIGLALATLETQQNVAWAFVTREMMRATAAEEEAADEVVRVMQRIAGVQVLVLFKEREDGTTKISLRSRPPYDVARLAQHWGGGGHTQASGATLSMPPHDAAAQVLPRLLTLIEGKN